jgi:hypothetical protein
MVPHMTECGNTTSEMGRADSKNLTDAVMTDSGTMVRNMVKERWYFQMTLFIMEVGQTI